jgi:hypothetical protein
MERSTLPLRLFLRERRREFRLVSLFHFSLNIVLFILLDPLAKILNGPDKDVIAHARDVVANSLMTEITKEDPQGQAEYKDAVRHQVVATFQRIRVLLLVLDTLMETYNAPH